MRKTILIAEKKLSYAAPKILKEFSARTREELEKIWVQRKELEKEATGIDI